eukprot:15444450-Alexandrium_andersonii.AAC.1
MKRAPEKCRECRRADIVPGLWAAPECARAPAGSKGFQRALEGSGDLRISTNGPSRLRRALQGSGRLGGALG